MGMHIELKYPSVREMGMHSFSNIADRNTFVDAVLQCVYEHVRSLPADSTTSSIFFSSFNPAICTVINWKQPNCKYSRCRVTCTFVLTWNIDAVFFSSHCGFDKSKTQRGVKRKAPEGEEDAVIHRNKDVQDIRSSSLKEAVKFAKRNNLLGVICEALPLVNIMFFLFFSHNYCANTAAL